MTANFPNSFAYSLPDWMQLPVLDIPLSRYAWAFLIVLAAMALRKVVLSVLLNSLHAWTKTTRFNLDNLILGALKKPVNFLTLGLGIYFAMISFTCPLDDIQPKNRRADLVREQAALEQKKDQVLAAAALGNPDERQSRQKEAEKIGKDIEAINSSISNLDEELQSVETRNGQLQSARGFLGGFLSALLAFSIGWIFYNLVDVLTAYLRNVTEKTETKLDDQLVPLVHRALKVFVFIMASVVVLQELGFSVTSVVAGLGLGGLAFALAAQDTVANLFGSVTIFVDKPFTVGDIVDIGGKLGTVEEVGFRSTRIRTFEDVQVIIPNNQMASSTIENYSRRQKRRSRRVLGIEYGTTREKMQSALEAIRQILNDHAEIEKGTSLVRFTEFDDSSLNILVQYWILNAEYEVFVRVEEELNLCFMDAFEKLGVSFAFPTQTLYLRKEDQAKP